MKRAVTEWGLVCSLVLLAALGLVWVGSLFFDYIREPLYLGKNLFVRMNDGRFCLFSELSPDWKPRLTQVEPRAMSWVRRYKIWMLPGFEYHLRQFASGRDVWSFEVSMVIPVVVLLTTMTVLWRVRTGCWRWHRSINSRKEA